MMVPHRNSMQFDLPSGTRLGGKYELLRKLATGGMAEIYLARASGAAGFEKLVVVKRILPTVAEDPNFVQMFLDEARLAATLRHPNVADVYEVGEDDGTPFFAMEFIHGQDVRAIRLASHARREPVPLAISLAIMYGTASALDYAHALAGPDGRPLHLVHRDVSASNVIVSYEGAVKLIDFGIARASSRRHETQVGALKGKIPYMSPEQCRGERLDRRSDLFSLGVVIYELTTGRRPFVGDSDFAIMDQIVYHAAPRPSELVRGYPPELEAIVMRLLARTPDERYPSAEELLRDLDSFIGQHRLYVPPKGMSKYMRMLFASQLAGFEDPDLDAGTRAERVLATLTGQSQGSQPLTPVSSFPPVVPLSEALAAAAPPDDQPAAWAPVPPVSPVIGGEPSPAIASRLRGGRLVFPLLAVAALAAGGLAGHQLVNRDRGGGAQAIAAPIAPAEAHPARVEPRPVEPRPPFTEPRPPEAKGDPTDEAGGTPGPSPDVAARIADPAPAGERSPSRAGAGAKSGAAAKRPPRSAPIAPPKRPSTRPPAVQDTPPKETPATPPKQAPQPPDRSKDPSWDQNDKDSPFLPD